MDHLSKTLADVALAGIGLTVMAAEKTGELVKICAEKGGDFLDKSKTVGAEWKEKAEQKAAEGRERGKQEFLEHLSAEERADLRRRLADLDAKEAEEARMAAEVSKVIDFEPEQQDEE